MIKNPFHQLPLPAAMIQNLTSLGFEAMTPIQEASLPVILKGQDVIAQAKTGSGKTVAFGIGLLSKLDFRQTRVQAAVLCPTRELAQQVAQEIRRLARHMQNIKVLTLCGGTPMAPQRESLAFGAHIVVGTPGRIQDLLHYGALDLRSLRTLVLDEADRMLDMGFLPAISEIMKSMPQHKQTLLFSATFPEEIRSLSASIQNKPADIKTKSEEEPLTIQQLFYHVEKAERLEALSHILSTYQPESTIIFCNMKVQCHEIAQHLHDKGLSVLSLHGDLEQRERDDVVARFSNKSISILVATDVAARGLDIKDVQAVINYDLPRMQDVYTHRIGRTGRAGKPGVAISFFTRAQAGYLKDLTEGQDYEVRKISPEEQERAIDFTLVPPMVSLQISAGKRSKIRPGDILGALTAPGGLTSAQVGKIAIYDYHTFVGIERQASSKAHAFLQDNKIKNFRLKCRLIDSFNFGMESTPS